MLRLMSVFGPVDAHRQLLAELYFPDSVSTPRADGPPPSASGDAVHPRALSHGHVTASSSFPESPNVIPETMTSESVSVDVEGSGTGVDGGSVELTLWIQWTLMKCLINVVTNSDSPVSGR